MRHGRNLRASESLVLDERYEYLLPWEERTCGGAFTGWGRREGRRTETLLLLDRLARKMKADSGRSTENPRIPAGYTYLGQLIAHDVTFSPSSLPIATGTATAVENVASSILDLDCIYGGGPAKSPWLYEPETAALDAHPPSRKYLRLGWTRPSGSQKDSRNADDQPRKQDLPRVCPHFAVGNLTRSKNAETCLLETLVGDPRNEDNLILSQLVVLFHMFHNKVVDIVSGKLTNPQDNLRVFEISRSIVVHFYREIVEREYLKLVLDDAIYDAYAQTRKATLADFPFLERIVQKHKRLLIPAEFAAAAFRFGHAMVQPHYRLNTQLSQGVNPKGPSLEELMSFDSEFARTVSVEMKIGSVWIKLEEEHAANADSRRKLPLTNNWLIDWPRFFPLASAAMDGAINKSRRIEPSAPGFFFRGEFKPEPGHLPAADLEQIKGGLLYRDLARAYDMGIPSGQALACAFNERGISFEPLTNGELLGGQGDVEGGLLHVDPIDGNPLIDEAHVPPDRDARRLAEDTPLFYYVLREAQVRNNGECLGPLGSAILAEVLIGSLRLGGHPTTEENVLVREFLAGEPNLPRTMPELVRFVDPEAYLGADG